MNYDQIMMSPEDFNRSKLIKDQWAIAPDDASRANAHNALESIRAGYGYSGGADGSGYTAMNTPPKSPTIGTYTSNYADQIDSALSAFINKPDFSWNPDDDEAYQAFLGNVNRSAESTFNDTIAGVSVGSGGRPNSWAATVASNAMGDILMQGAAEMPTFRDAAFNMYQAEGQLDLQQLEALMGLDKMAYGQFIDSYNAEVDQFKLDLTAKESAVNEAMSRTQMTGYVSNADALLLGVAAGTPSQAVMESTMAMNDYIAKLKADLQYKGNPTGDPTGGKDLIDSDMVYKLLKSKVGVDDEGVLGGTPEERGAYLYGLYQSKQITEQSLMYYAAQYTAKLPAEADAAAEDGGRLNLEVPIDQKYVDKSDWTPKMNSIFAELTQYIVSSPSDVLTVRKEVQAKIKALRNKGDIKDGQAIEIMQAMGLYDLKE